jgi:hypothetical protein
MRYEVEEEGLEVTEGEQEEEGEGEGELEGEGEGEVCDSTVPRD